MMARPFSSPLWLVAGRVCKAELVSALLPVLDPARSVPLVAILRSCRTMSCSSNRDSKPLNEQLDESVVGLIVQIPLEMKELSLARQ